MSDILILIIWAGLLIYLLYDMSMLKRKKNQIEKQKELVKENDA